MVQISVNYCKVYVFQCLMSMHDACAQISDKYIAVLVCPLLKTIDDKPIDRFQSFVQNCREKFQKVVGSLSYGK